MLRKFFSGLGPQNQQYLRDAGAIPKLVDLLFRADSEMKRGVFSDHEGVVPEDVAEGCTGALHVLARDQTNRSLIRQSNVIPTICGFLGSTNENMQRSAGNFNTVPCPLCCQKCSQKILCTEVTRSRCCDSLSF